MKKITVGIVEDVEIKGKKFKARIDTGAYRSSIDIDLAKKLGLGPVFKKVNVRSASGKSQREVIKAKVSIKGQEMEASFSIINREHMDYKVLIGRNILKRGFLIDATKI